MRGNHESLQWLRVGAARARARAGCGGDTAERRRDEVRRREFSDVDGMRRAAVRVSGWLWRRTKTKKSAGATG